MPVRMRGCGTIAFCRRLRSTRRSALRETWPGFNGKSQGPSVIAAPGKAFERSLRARAARELEQPFGSVRPKQGGSGSETSKSY